jgi:hypothetical protein
VKDIERETGARITRSILRDDAEFPLAGLKVGDVVAILGPAEVKYTGLDLDVVIQNYREGGKTSDLVGRYFAAVRVVTGGSRTAKATTVVLSDQIALPGQVYGIPILEAEDLKGSLRIMRSKRRLVVLLGNLETLQGAIKAHPDYEAYAAAFQERKDYEAGQDAILRAAQAEKEAAEAPIKAEAEALNAALGRGVFFALDRYGLELAATGRGTKPYRNFVEEILAGRLVLGRITREQYDAALAVLPVADNYPVID